MVVAPPDARLHIRRVESNQVRIKRRHFERHLIARGSDRDRLCLHDLHLVIPRIQFDASAEGQCGDLIQFCSSRGPGPKWRAEPSASPCRFRVMLLPRCACNRAPNCGARACRALMKSPAVSSFWAYGDAFSISIAFLSAAASSSGMCLNPRFDTCLRQRTACGR